MKQAATFFLQVAIIILGVVVLALLIWLPQTEGRAENLDLFSIYTDPFILYAYASSIVFFVALYHAFRLIGYVRDNRVFSHKSVSAVRTIKKCAILMGILIVLAGIFIRIFHHPDDDPAGFLAMCIAVTLVLGVVTAAAFVFEKILQEGMDINANSSKTPKRKSSIG